MKAQDIAQKIINGNQLAGARLIRLLEEEDPAGIGMLKHLYPHTGSAFVAGVTGPPGSGKSTLLGMMGAMNAPTSGRLIVDDIDIYTLGQEQRADFRREFLGFIFQSFIKNVNK